MLYLYMTTIIANGHYLLADHRASEKTKIYKCFDLKETSDKEKEVTLNDDIFKITLGSDIPFKVKGQRVLAFAMAGTLRIYSRFNRLIELLSLYDADGFDIEKAPNVLSQILDVDNHSSVVGITDDHLAFSYNLTTSEVDIADHVSTTYSTGSGGEYTSYVSKMNPDVDLYDRFAYASVMDPGTSPSYSVFGSRENILYRGVFPSRTEIRKSLCKFLNEDVAIELANKIRTY